MHFYYLDEAGCTGGDLENPEQPIFVSGGVIVRDEGWNRTKENFDQIILNFFNGDVAPNFELHANELLSPEGEGFFTGYSREHRNALAHELLDLITNRSHQIAFCAIEKTSLNNEDNSEIESKNYFNKKTPYLLAYDYLISLFENHTQRLLGRSARGMIIIDIKEEFNNTISVITNHRRYCVPNNQRIIWLTEFTYSVDSRKNPMIQLSDLVCFLTKKFLEIDKGYRENYSSEVKNIYKEFYLKIHNRSIRNSVLRVGGNRFNDYNALIQNVMIFPRRGFSNFTY